MKSYNHKSIESKWQKEWDKKKSFKTKDPSGSLKKKKFFILDMFPYPSGAGLHVGHPKGYIATDIISRMKRMQNFNVLHPMGWDAFGLPAEQYAIKIKTNPTIAVSKNIKKFKEQLEIIGLDYDWSREVNTTDPKFYKWTQWIFLKLLEKGLAYESYEPINWCPSCKTGLSNEDLEDGKCERCSSVVEKKPMRQWVLKITDYADRLIDDLDLKDKDGNFVLDWPENIKESQRNWIGRSEGAEIKFKIQNSKVKSTSQNEKNEEITVFTTRPDTLFGVTYLVVAPEHEIISKIKNQNEKLQFKIENLKEVEEYVNQVKNKTEIERTDAKKEKTGVLIKGLSAINPANGEEVPVFVADYILGDYGTGAVMAVPAHDERDFEFAKKYSLPIRQIINGGELPFLNDGKLINSNQFDGLSNEEAKTKIVDFVGGKIVKKYKLRDWVFSRQRYWGEPIPVLKDRDGKIIPLKEKDLPLVLPKVKSYEPTGTGESPLANIKNWIEVKNGKEILMRESNTMPQWAGSSWYYLRYMDPKNNKNLVESQKEKYWNTVDLYVGGAEHATRHLIYARFWHKFLFDLGIVSTKEPFKKLQSVGLILAEDGRKMSKRFGNVVNPDDIVKTYGADTLRVYEMFMGPFDQSISWNTKSIIGSRRFLERVWRIQSKVKNHPKTKSSEILFGQEKLESLLNKTIKKVSENIESMKFNTAISSLMICLNEMEKEEEVLKSDFEKFILLLSPFAPHITSELWQILGNKKDIVLSAWPKYDPNKIQEDEIKIGVQINGRVRGDITVSVEEDESIAVEKAKQNPDISKWIEGKEIKKVIYIKGKILNILV